MNTTHQRICLVHYHEIGLKGRNRASFEKRLVKNIKTILGPLDFPIVTIHRVAGRLCIFLREGCDLNTALCVCERVKKIPGVARVSCGFKCERDIEEMGFLAGQALGEVKDFESFKVQARRNHTDFEIDSMQLNQIIGAVLCKAFPDKAVKMKDPDCTVAVEVVQNAVYIYAYSQRGIGGLPVGVSGRVVALLSSGIDSPVALWHMARRGAVCIGVHFSGRPQTLDTSEYLVDDIAGVLEKSGCIARVYIVPFGDYQKEIALACPAQLRVILYRRLMFKIAEAIAHKEKARALVTGESLGQVASQTLDNLYATDNAVDLPVFRPLIGSDKFDIIEEAQRLGTFEISSQDAPDCCTLFMPRNPETHAKLDQVLQAESAYLNDDLVEEILQLSEIHDYSY